VASGDPRSDDSTETERRPPDDATLTSGPTGGSPAEPVTLVREGGTGSLPDLGLTTVPRELYLVEGEIARGGMGRVLAARDRRLGRPVALKELPGAPISPAASSAKPRRPDDPLRRRLLGDRRPDDDRELPLMTA
jgi:serine/threonine protein kinase